jgi:molecular chaperone DnaK (HSP70)
MTASTDDGEVLVGQPAKRQSITNSENTDAMEVSGYPVLQ